MKKISSTGCEKTIYASLHDFINKHTYVLYMYK